MEERDQIADFDMSVNPSLEIQRDIFIYFYRLYSQLIENHPQGVDDFILNEICSIPWFHQRTIIDKSKGDAQKALFFVRKVIENNWGRNVLLNFLNTDLYERQAKAITNFSKTLPALQSDLAQQATKDPYVFNFLTMTEGYNERELEDALVANVTKFLVELGTGFAYNLRTQDTMNF